MQKVTNLFFTTGENSLNGLPVILVILPIINLRVKDERIPA